MRRNPQSEQPGAASFDGESTEYSQDYEIVREDAKGKFMTIVDATHFDEHYRHLFLVPEEEKRGPNKRKAPFHKMALKLVTYEPNTAKGEEKGSWKQYLEVKSFLRLCDIVLSRPIAPDKNEAPYGAEVFKSMGFSGGKGRELSVSVVESASNAGATMFKFQFRHGEAVENPNGPGFKFTGNPPRNVIFLPEDQALQMFIEARDHVNSLRAAVNTRMFEELYGKK